MRSSDPQGRTAMLIIEQAAKCRSLLLVLQTRVPLLKGCAGSTQGCRLKDQAQLRDSRWWRPVEYKRSNTSDIPARTPPPLYWQPQQPCPQPVCQGDTVL
ncbi:unnamed protein product [Rangifer tarandus platyrhynchus]|uniref:Uncharacterized protein n=2 Tax=Rangifer tarandus platyrhynchus TaxID=3082113 RepID=A0AC60A529_RANTA|nr:unnamed protein product [Rangifer tarandus platyrhynchus]